MYITCNQLPDRDHHLTPHNHQRHPAARRGLASQEEKNGPRLSTCL